MKLVVEELHAAGRLVRWDKFKERVFSSGVEPSLRQKAWKFLLGFYSHDSSRVERKALRKAKKEQYKNMKLQWKILECDEEQASRYQVSQQQDACMLLHTQMV